MCTRFLLYPSRIENFNLTSNSEGFLFHDLSYAELEKKIYELQAKKSEIHAGDGKQFSMIASAKILFDIEPAKEVYT
jgi:hypothetical protein